MTISECAQRLLYSHGVVVDGPFDQRYLARVVSGVLQPWLTIVIWEGDRVQAVDDGIGVVVMEATLTYENLIDAIIVVAYGARSVYSRSPLQA